MWWRHTTTTFLGVLFGTYKRRRRDVLMGRRGYVPLRCLGNVPLRRRWVFHLRLFQTSWRRNDGASLSRLFEASLWRSNKTSLRRTTETSWRRSIETSLGVSFETYLRRRWDLQRDVAATSPRRLSARWVIVLQILNRQAKIFYAQSPLKEKKIKNTIFHRIIQSNVTICHWDFLKVAALKPRKIRECWEAATRGVL